MCRFLGSSPRSVGASCARKWWSLLRTTFSIGETSQLPRPRRNIPPGPPRCRPHNWQGASVNVGPAFAGGCRARAADPIHPQILARRLSLERPRAVLALRAGRHAAGPHRRQESAGKLSFPPAVHPRPDGRTRKREPETNMWLIGRSRRSLTRDICADWPVNSGSTGAISA